MSYNTIEAKIVVLGSTGVGKTSIVSRYIGKGYNRLASPTIGASFFTCKIAIDCFRVKLQVWDTAGQERFRSMAPMYYRKANAALLVYDMTSRESYEEMKVWVTELQRNVENSIVLCVVGNKYDLSSTRLVPVEEAQDYAVTIGAFHFETSAATNEGIERVFLHVAKSLIFQYESDDSYDMSGSAECNATRGILTSLGARKSPTITLERTPSDNDHKEKAKCCES